MQRHVFPVLLMSAIGIVSAQAEPLSLTPNRYAQASVRPPTPAYVAPQAHACADRGRARAGGAIRRRQFRRQSRRRLHRVPVQRRPRGGAAASAIRYVWRAASPSSRRRSPSTRAAIDPKFLKQVVPYRGSEPAGTIVIDTPQRFLFLVQDNGTAVRYGIGVGKPGFTWAGEKKVSAKKEWPDWTPPPEMLQRRPDLPHFMAGGPENPLGARAMYLGSSLYRIHGSNEPWTIGQAVSSGCIRMRNEDVIDLYEKVKVGTKVVVI